MADTVITRVVNTTSTGEVTLEVAVSGSNLARWRYDVTPPPVDPATGLTASDLSDWGTVSLNSSENFVYSSYKDTRSFKYLYVSGVDNNDALLHGPIEKRIDFKRGLRYAALYSDEEQRELLEGVGIPRVVFPTPALTNHGSGTEKLRVDFTNIIGGPNVNYAFSYSMVSEARRLKYVNVLSPSDISGTEGQAKLYIEAQDRGTKRWVSLLNSAYVDVSALEAETPLFVNSSVMHLSLPKGTLVRAKLEISATTNIGHFVEAHLSFDGQYDEKFNFYNYDTDYSANATTTPVANVSGGVSTYPQVIADITTLTTSFTTLEAEVDTFTGGLSYTQLLYRIQQVETDLSNYIAENDKLAVKNLAYSDSPYAVEAAFNAFVIDASSGAIVINLPARSTVGVGKKYWFKITNASQTNSVTIDGDGSDQIDNATTLVVEENYAGMTLFCDASQWYIM